MYPDFKSFEEGTEGPVRELQVWDERWDSLTAAQKFIRRIIGSIPDEVFKKVAVAITDGEIDLYEIIDDEIEMRKQRDFNSHGQK